MSENVKHDNPALMPSAGGRFVVVIVDWVRMRFEVTKDNAVHIEVLSVFVMPSKDMFQFPLMEGGHGRVKLGIQSFAR